MEGCFLPGPLDVATGENQIETRAESIAKASTERLRYPVLLKSQFTRCRPR